jgi:hypothetical protein
MYHVSPVSLRKICPKKSGIIDAADDTVIETKPLGDKHARRLRESLGHHF